MNEIINKFFLAGDKFMLISGMNLRLPQFNYSACGPFFKNLKKHEIQNTFIKKS